MNEEKKARVLVVDDFPANRELLARRIGRAGYDVVEAENGAEALRQLSLGPIDVVLLDIRMPIMDGFAVLEKMQASKEFSRIPVIVISAGDDVDSIARAIELGAIDYLVKPFNPTLLMARLKASLQKKKIHDLEKRAEELLKVIFPGQALEEYQKTGTIEPRAYDNVAVLFCDIVDFSHICREKPATEVVSTLQNLVTRFEDLALKYNILKMKTVGDAFLCTDGLLTHSGDPVRNSVACGLEMIQLAPEISGGWEVRVGVHIGPLIAGVVGRRQYLYDIYGETVNMAWRITEHGGIGSMTLTKAAWDHVSSDYEGISLGKYPIKGVETVELFHVVRRKENLSQIPPAAL